MTLFVAWIVFPAIVLILSTGLGLAVERAAGIDLPGALIMPVGFCGLVVVSQLATNWSATAGLASASVVVLALAGIGLGRQRLRRPRIDRAALVAAAATFIAFGAPVFLSGDATFAGYQVLGDPSAQFSVIDHLMAHGRDLSGLSPSSYRTVVQSYFLTGYPLGAQTALGVASPLSGLDVAWLFQPFLAVISALTSLVLYQLARLLIDRRWLCALVAVVASQPALVYGYALEGGIKELSSVLVIALFLALVAVAARSPRDRVARSLIVVAVVAAAGLEVLGLAIAAWLGPLGLALLVVLARGRAGLSRVRVVVVGALLTLVVAALALPATSRIGTYLSGTTDTLTGQDQLGNLIHPLHKLQAFGIWLTGDFRITPLGGDLDLSHGLVALAGAAICVGIVWCVARKQPLPLLYLAVSVLGSSYVFWRGSPWVDAKALLIASVPLVFMALVGALALERVWKPASIVLTVAIAGGVLWSNALAYDAVSLAPRDRLSELEGIGHHLDRTQTTLYTEFEEYAKHFLRRGNPSGWSESWQPGGLSGTFGTSEDVDRVPGHYLTGFTTLVMRKSPTLSRPPSSYHIVYATKHYQVWRRPQSAGILPRLGLGSKLNPTGTASCSELRSLVRGVDPRSVRLAYVKRQPVSVFVPSRAKLPPGWPIDISDRDSVLPSSPGAIEGQVRVAKRRRYSVWLAGSFGRRISVAIDGRTVGSVAYQLNGRNQYERLGELSLSAGLHSIAIRRGSGDALRPGSGGSYTLIGPVVLEPMSPSAPTITTTSVAHWRQLCERPLDWVELVRR